jgi:hypothetical protein
MRKIGDGPPNAAARPYPLNHWNLQTLSLLRPDYLIPALTRQSKDIELEKLLYYNIYRYLLLMSSVNGRPTGYRQRTSQPGSAEGGELKNYRLPNWIG